MRLIVLTYLLFVVIYVFSQESDIPRNKQKFEFEKYNNGKIKKLKQGTYIEVVSYNKDTTHIQSGDLIDLNDSLLIINMSFEDFKLVKENFTFSKYFIYETPYKTSIPINSIDYLSYESKGLFVFASLGGVSLFTALIIAPLVSIDRSAPNNFNSKRYTSIMRPALIGTAVGLTIGFDTMIKLKLPTKNKPH
ncbi:MAG: hypothetical protein KatS3mg034_0153 [Vicingaceae bacterium]|nr:MAG: hypothetical protein KatS3mg034_0153 [Vicingaceae bacterium]